MVITYNGFVRKRNMIKNAYGSIDVNLMKRSDLIPNLVETVKAYAKHERQTFELVTSLRAKSQQPQAPNERLRTEEQMRPAISRLMALSENYPNLKADSQFINLQRNLTEVEEQISASRRAYNAASFEMNNSVQSFPSSIIANIFKFDENNYFEIEQDNRRNPEVKL